MISNKEMSIASASTDAMRAKGQDFFFEFYASHEDEVTAYQNRLLQDSTNFSAFGSERRQQMLQEFALGVVYLMSLSDEEKAGVALIAHRQYKQNSQVMLAWLISGGTILALLAAFFLGNRSNENYTPKTSLLTPVEISRLA